LTGKNINDKVNPVTVGEQICFLKDTRFDATLCFLL